MQGRDENRGDAICFYTEQRALMRGPWPLHPFIRPLSFYIYPRYMLGPVLSLHSSPLFGSLTTAFHSKSRRLRAKPYATPGTGGWKAAELETANATSLAETCSAAACAACAVTPSSESPLQHLLQVREPACRLGDGRYLVRIAQHVLRRRHPLEGGAVRYAWRAESRILA